MRRRARSLEIETRNLCMQSSSKLGGEGGRMEGVPMLSVIVIFIVTGIELVERHSDNVNAIVIVAAREFFESGSLHSLPSSWRPGTFVN
jgi:hypothetical protein